MRKAAQPHQPSGKDLNALREALRTVNAVRSAAAPYPRSRLVSICGQLRQWFSVRKWQEVSDPAGLNMGGWLMLDIEIVELGQKRPVERAARFSG